MLFGSGRKATHGQFGMNQRLDSLFSKIRSAFDFNTPFCPQSKQMMR